MWSAPTEGVYAFLRDLVLAGVATAFVFRDAIPILLREAAVWVACVIATSAPTWARGSSPSDLAIPALRWLVFLVIAGTVVRRLPRQDSVRE